MSAEFDIQAAVFSALSGSSAVTDLVSTIVDFGPREDDAAAIYPYIAIGNIFLNEMDTDNTNGFDAVMRIHTWTNTGSAKLAKDTQGAIYGVLHKADLSVTGFDTINLYRVDSRVMQAASGAHQGVCEYRGLFDKT